MNKTKLLRILHVEIKYIRVETHTSPGSGNDSQGTLEIINSVILL